jgi:hypothetical protein
MLFSIVALFLLLALIWLARQVYVRGRREVNAERVPVEDLFPVHCGHFPQILQALSDSDADYLSFRVSSKIRRRVSAERRAIVRSFLNGLLEDFRRLDRLGRTVASLAPELERSQESHHLRLALQFRALYLLVQVRLTVGSVSIPQLTHLTDVVGRYAAQLEAAMARLEGLSLDGARGGFSA